MQFFNAIRSVVFYLALVLLTCLWFLPSLLFAFVLPLRARVHYVQRAYCFCVVWLLRVLCGVRWQINGLSNIPTDGTACVILSKHQSTWETFMLPLLLSPQVPVLKQELLSIPLFGWLLKRIHPIAIDRSKKTNALRQVIQQGTERLAAGYHVLIFPEGTRVAPGQRKVFSKSAAMLARQCRVPVLAVAHNSGEHWPNHSWIKTPGEIRVSISPAFTDHDLSTSELNDLVEHWINEHVEQLSNTRFAGNYHTADNSGKRF